jgi:protein-tyrosine phosphatase
MLGGVLVEKNNYSLNIDRILDINNISFYVSGYLIPETLKNSSEYSLEYVSVINSISDLLQVRNIGLVIDLSNYLNDIDKGAILTKIFGDNGVEYSRFDFNDSADVNQIPQILTAIIKIIPEIHKFYLSSTQNILIHCRAGQNRSQFMFIVYLLIYHPYSYRTIRVFLLRNRQQFIMNNPLFISLLYFINKNKECILTLINTNEIQNINTNEIIHFLQQNKDNIMKLEMTIYKKYMIDIISNNFMKNIKSIGSLMNMIDQKKN